MMAPVGVVGQAVGAALLPTLTALFAARRTAAGFDALLGLDAADDPRPRAAGRGRARALAGPVVGVVYQRGRFAWRRYATSVSALLVVLAFAVPGWVVQQVAVRGFYARGEMWRAMALEHRRRAGGLSALHRSGRPAGSGVLGLALASATAITLNALVTVLWLRSRAGAPDPARARATLWPAGARGRGDRWAAPRRVLLALSVGGSLGALLGLPLGGAVVRCGRGASATRCVGDAPLRADSRGIVRGCVRRRAAAGSNADRGVTGASESGAGSSGSIAAAPSRTASASRPTAALHTTKVLSSDAAPVEAIEQILARAGGGAAAGARTARLKLGTTVATNALLERRGVPTALLTNEGLSGVFDDRDPGAAGALRARDRATAVDCSDGGSRSRAGGTRVAPWSSRSISRGRAASCRTRVPKALDSARDRLDARARLSRRRAKALASCARELGFSHVVASHEMAREIGLLARGETAIADAYLTPLLRGHVEGARARRCRAPSSASCSPRAG